VSSDGLSKVLADDGVYSRTDEAAERRRAHSIDHAGLEIKELARKSSLEVGSTREKNCAEKGKCKKLRVEIWPGNKKMQVVRACFPNEKVKLFLRPLEL
jgi:hypothetical protein